MNQSVTQTITVTTTSAPGAPNTGFLANTGENWPLIAALGGVLLILAIILAVWIRHGGPHLSKVRRFLLLTGAVGGAGALIAATTPFVSATASLDLTPQNQTIFVAQGSSTTVPTTATLHTTSTAGYVLTLVQAQTANGVSATVKGGDVLVDTLVTGSPINLKSSTIASAAAGDTVNSTLTVTASTNTNPGTSDLKLTYRLTETPIPTNPNVCTNADPTSACQVDMDTALIPVRYTGTTSAPQWSKADVSAQGDWYNYQAKQWANAVAVTSATRTTYQNAVAGTVIPENDVLGYYTYIPRYQYQVCRPNASDPISGITASGCPSDVTTPYDFNIKFQTASQTTAYNGTVVGGWATHPAFTFGSTQLNGIWVGKYQTSTDSQANVCNKPNCGDQTGGTTAAQAAVNGGVYIKPNQFGFSNQTVSDQFATAQDLTNSSSATYQGMSASTTDSRMMTNSDWGAVSYLTTSSYGKGAANPIDINNCVAVDWNNINARTGWGGGSPDADYVGQSCVIGINDSGAYQTAQGQGASTTGNTSGIYDMAGGNWQYVMAHLTNDTGDPNYSDLSGFASLPNDKYFNRYSNATFNDDSTGYFSHVNLCTWAVCGGQAWIETTLVSPVTSFFDQSWRGECSSSVNMYQSWVVRGGGALEGSGAGLFCTVASNGSQSVYFGFRVVQSRF